MSLDAQPVFRCLQLSGCLVDGSSSWGGSKVSGITDSSRGSCCCHLLNSQSSDVC